MLVAGSLIIVGGVLSMGPGMLAAPLGLVLVLTGWSLRRSPLGVDVTGG